MEEVKKLRKDIFGTNVAHNRKGIVNANYKGANNLTLIEITFKDIMPTLSLPHVLFYSLSHSYLINFVRKHKISIL